jgi:hypothetical protein
MSFSDVKPPATLSFDVVPYMIIGIIKINRETLPATITLPSDDRNIMFYLQRAMRFMHKTMSLFLFQSHTYSFFHFVDFILWSFSLEILEGTLRCTMMAVISSDSWS